MWHSRPRLCAQARAPAPHTADTVEALATARVEDLLALAEPVRERQG
jgi:hypothetical protein